MAQSKNPNPAPHSKPWGIRVGLFLVRFSLLGIVTLVLLIGVAWAFGALWFDFPFSVLRRPLAIAFGLAAIGALAFVRPGWLARVTVAGVGFAAEPEACSAGALLSLKTKARTIKKTIRMTGCMERKKAAIRAAPFCAGSQQSLVLPSTLITDDVSPARAILREKRCCWQS